MTFYQKAQFNQPVSVPAGVTDTSSMFFGCKNLNSSVNMAITNTQLKDVTSMFSGCSNFNQQRVTIPYNVVYANGFLQDCYNFNGTVSSVGGNISYAAKMFANCTNFNRSVGLTTGLTEMRNMLEGCTSFNKTVMIPDGVINAQGAFFRAFELNSFIDLGNTVQNISTLFGYATNYNTDIYIPDSVTNAYRLLYYCQNFGANVYINRVTAGINVTGIFSNCNNSRRKNIFCNNLALVNGTTLTTSVTATAISWTATANGYYNSVYNIYLFSNYSE